MNERMQRLTAKKAQNHAHAWDTDEVTNEELAAVTGGFSRSVNTGPDGGGAGGGSTPSNAGGGGLPR